MLSFGLTKHALLYNFTDTLATWMLGCRKPPSVSGRVQNAWQSSGRKIGAVAVG